MTRRFARIALAAAAVVMVIVASMALAEARPGGGHSYSGGSSHSGGSGGSGDGGALIELLIYLIIYHPQVGIPVALVVGVAVFVAKRKNDGLGDWDSGESIAAAAPSSKLDDVRAHDPDFSQVLFTDFVYALYATAHRARSSAADLAGLAPYLSPAARDHLASRLPAGEPVLAVIVGACRVTRASVPSAAVDHDGTENAVRVSVMFESNMIVGAGADQRKHFTTESWSLIRRASARSRPPESAKTFGCPNCGAPFESTDDATCGYCGEVVAAGRFDWAVETIHLLSDEVRPPNLLGHAPERGTQLATVHDPSFQHAFASLQAEDPSVTHETIFARMQSIFLELNRAWSQLDLRPARPFISDGMKDYLGYWMDAYRAQGLRNVTENPEITGWDLARVTRDRYFDSIVVRIFARSLDYTVDDQNGKVVGGSRSKPREYSEYWTLIRGASVRGKPPSDKNCPNCGAELNISMGGTCEFCDAHVTAGEFDWVLSKIEQDEAYRG